MKKKSAKNAAVKRLGGHSLHLESAFHPVEAVQVLLVQVAPPEPAHSVKQGESRLMIIDGPPGIGCPVIALKVTPNKKG